MSQQPKKIIQCTLCKHLGKHSEIQMPLDRVNLYNAEGATVPINLCRKHAVELFKLGQKNFLLSYCSILEGIVDSDEKKFLDVMREVIAKHY